VSAPATTAIPYQSQQDLPNGLLCGAASLCMAAESLGVPCSQREVWPRVSESSGRGRRAKTYLLGREARRLGLAALVLQASDPWRALVRCHDEGLRVILNHRVAAHAGAGHYSVLASADAGLVMLHDPRVGPHRKVGREEFLRLWQPGSHRPEIAGNVLVALARDPPAAPACPTCGGTVPASVGCPHCGHVFSVAPAAALGCGAAPCPARVWNCIFCPGCDGRVSGLS
jgi:hypothetical protein